MRANGSIGATPEHGLYALMQQCRQHDLLAVLTSPDNNPPRIARMLQAEGLAEAFEMAVAQALKQPGQAVTGFLPVSAVAAGVLPNPMSRFSNAKRRQPPLCCLASATAAFSSASPKKA